MPGAAAWVLSSWVAAQAVTPAGATDARPRTSAGEYASALGISGLPRRAVEDPFGLFTGIPDNVRYQTWGFVLTVQNIPILETGYWDRAIGGPYDLNRSTNVKLRQLPAVLRMVFYDNYMRSLGVFALDRSPDAAYRAGGLENAWTSVHLGLTGPDSQALFSQVSGALSSRFSPEEMADLAVWLLAQALPHKFTRDEWRHAQHVAFYNAAWVGAAFFGYQFSQNNAQLRGGRWFQLSNFSVGTFATVRRLGVRWRPDYAADLRFSVPGMETSFTVGGRLDDRPETELLGLDAGVRVNWLNYFARSMGWDLFAAARAHHTLLHTTAARERDLTTEGRLSGRRENLGDLDGLALGVDGAVRTDWYRTAAVEGSVAVEHVPAEAAAGMRLSTVGYRDKRSEFAWAFFLAAPFRPPTERPLERDYQLHARLMREQALVVQRLLEGEARARRRDARARGAEVPAGTAHSLELARRSLLQRVDATQDARDKWRASLRGRDRPLEGYVTEEELAAARALAGERAEAP
ncbi:MAG: hypothetical protein HY904_24280 [Deltaproteobacteria bacterium]|nr:hypothetical protein [Deltaproteobacteria bacterium]